MNNKLHFIIFNVAFYNNKKDDIVYNARDVSLIEGFRQP